ncbi:DUF4199 domain-containing protein [Myroides odoratimimus]|uniref:Uncharacterized protein n=3 Tax=Myroides odoratimimus TaxID=76832 RepID=A0A0S7EGB6_9FLAO|nr:MULTISPECIES: DUF4199 domain-containing protein [Myroides]AJA67481.1 Protein of unknown function DUF4199 [Myroides sp. A21]ALU24767.1 hypothetical protein AS202_00515 [Myroides odoratimimus]APA90811.1 hypothetical protein BK054_00785 [Myroides sp. ZB35]EHO06920.1 hypothetical protein HMPREF9714_02771 [Myroides odoratimimus CCUG 12901]EHO07196.1 hypothetical protein HMPREF9715_02893 [Myroides odoratimimus CIP 101113]
MKNPVNKVGITFGIILAIYYTLFNSVIFFTDKALFANTFAGFFNMGVMVILGILTIYFARKKAGGYVTFREGFTPFFLMVIIGVTANIIIYNILFNIVDPSAKEEISKSLYDMLIKTLDGSGLPQEQINEQLEKARNINQFAPKSQLFLWAGSVLRNSILGILLAAIFKNKSEFVNPHPEINHDVDTDFNKDHK